MKADMRAAFLVGAFAGILFYCNALMPKSYLFPVVWPMLGGALITFRSSQSLVDGSGSRRVFALAAAVGVAAALFFLLPGLGTLYALSRVKAPSVNALPAMGVSGALDTSIVMNSVVVGLLAIPVASMIGSVLVWLALIRKFLPPVANN